MMKKQFRFLLIILTLISLTACGLAHEEGEHLEPLNPAEWPTPKSEVAEASPTPFPRATLRIESVSPTEEAQAEAPLPTAAPIEPAPATADAAPALEAAGIGGNSDLLGVLVSKALNQFSVVATGIVIAPDLSIRGGPGASYAPVGVIEPGDVFGILGKNSGGDWLYVVDASLSPGWLPTSGLRVVGSLEQAPVLPPNPLAALVQSASVSASNDSTSASAETVTSSSQPVAIANLTPVTTAQVDNDGLNLRQGPGAAYERVATLARDDQVTILALNPRQDWALVETASQQQGWVSLAYLAVAGSIANAPIVPTTTLGQSDAAVQAAPVLDIIEPATASNETTAAHPAAFGNLGPIATTRIARNEVDVRPGPGTDYAPIDTLTQTDEDIAILALDKSKKWVLAQPAYSEVGWVALNDLTIEGAPILEATLNNAPQVSTAWVESNAVEIRRGPGIYHDAVGVLAINSLISVLGLDESRSWALVKPIPAGGLGWAPVNFLKSGENWSDLPVVKDEDGGLKDKTEQPPPNPQPLILNPQPHIVFQRSSGGDIIVINPDGTGLRRLTSGIDPVLSPDGQTVAFTRWEGETGSLWLINLDGTNERSVLGFVKQAKGPDWSPDGSQVIFNFQTGGRTEPKTECFPLGEGQQPPRPPRNVTNIKVKVGSNGPELCWKLPPDPHWGLRVVNLADGGFKDIDGGTYAFRPAWDPNQSWRIISDGGRGLVEVDVNRDYRQLITDEINDGSPVFSPDGRFLAVAMGQQGGGPGWNIYRLNANGTGRVQLTETPLWETALPGNDQPWNNVAPAWSPDGSQIAFLTDRTGRWEIWVMNADGSDQHSLFSDEINDQLQISYNFVDERVLSWR